MASRKRSAKQRAHRTHFSYSRPKPTKCAKSSKKSWPSKREADLVLAYARGRDRGEQRSYHCSACGGWHLTSKPYRKPLSPVAREIIAAARL